MCERMAFELTLTRPETRDDADADTRIAPRISVRTVKPLFNKPELK
jgi:hypothetical protein